MRKTKQTDRLTRARRRLLLFLLAALPIYCFLSSCSQIDCPLNNRVYVVFRFMNSVGDSVKVSEVINVSTDRHEMEDSVVLNQFTGRATFSIPMSYTQDEDVYYFEEDGTAISGGKHTINGIEYEFTEDGRQAKVAFVVVPEGYTRGYWGDGYITGWTEIDGKTYHFVASPTQPGKMLTGNVMIQNYNGQGIVYHFAPDGHLLDYVWVEEEGGKRYYWAQTPQTGWVTIDGKQYYFDPGTALMQTGVVTIDNETYSFGDDGVLIHKGLHEDTDGDHLCDTCGEYIGSAPSFLSRFLRIFYSLIARIRACIHTITAKIFPH